MKNPRALLCVAPAALLATIAAPAQQRDPYSDGDPTLLSQLGYCSLGPFSWDGTYGTDHLARTLGIPHLRWVETAHFKIGIALPAREVPGESRLRRPVAQELEALHAILGKVDPRTRELDPWLLLHLYAMRLEKLYAAVADLLGVSDADFPSLDGKRTPKQFMGDGPFLGQRGKFRVVLFDRRTELSRYLRVCAGIDDREPESTRHVLARSKSLAFATASECCLGQLADDQHMHNHVVGEVAKNLLEGYKSKMDDLPVWLLEGFGHYCRRRIDPRFNLHDESTDADEQAHGAWRWDRRVRGRVKNDYYPKAAELLAAADATKWTAHQHMMVWSRVDFLITKDRGGLRRFLNELKDRPIPWRRLDAERIREWQGKALFKAWHLDLPSFDTEWRQFVLESYDR